MRKKLIAGALTLAVLLGGVTVANAGSQSDPLISLSYLAGQYLSDLTARITQWVAQDTQDIYNDAAARAGQGTVGADGWHTSNGFVQGQGKYADALTLASGAGLIWAQGSGALSSGVLVDATTGTELAPGNPMSPGHRYLAVTDSVVTASSQAVQWLAEGRWRSGTGGTVGIPLPFTDVATTDAFYDAVKWNYDHNFIKGTTPTTFRPYNELTRGQLVTILYRNAGSPAVNAPTVPYLDMPGNAEMYRAVLWATESKIVEGFPDRTFRPNNPVRNEQMAKILHDYNKYRGKADGVSTTDLNSRFTDAASIGDWAKSDVAWAVANGVMTGVNGQFQPQQQLQRWQAAVDIYNYGQKFGA